MLAELTLRAGNEIARAAVVVDVREGKMLDELPKVFRSACKAMRNLHPVLIFLDASDDVLVRRFSETRRPHPLAPDRSALEGIREERERMKPLRRLAEHIVDTSAMTVHELRHAFRNVEGGRSPGSQLVVTVLSFGFKHGIPVDSDLLFDVRFLPNPHFVPTLRPHTGRDPRGPRVPRQVAGDARVPRTHAQPAALPDPAVRRGRQVVPDDRRRLHRRAAPLGHDRGSAQEGAGRA